MYTYSIIIPHYNSSKLLERMLKSIPKREDIQVIVVDDCSKEEEIVNLKNLTHTNLEIYFQSSNHGAGAARNVGLKHVKGKWVIVVDADDVFAPNAFDVFDKYKDCNIDYLCYCVKLLKEDGTRGRDIVSDISVRKYLKKQNPKTLSLFKYKNTVCWNKMVSSNFIRSNQIKFEDCEVNNDVLYNLMIGLKSTNFIVIPDELYYPIEVSNSITHKKRTIEREFLFYLQAQKRNGFYEAIGLKQWPYYRYDFLYIPFMIKKHGLVGLIDFLWYRKKHQLEIEKARSTYLAIITD